MASRPFFGAWVGLIPAITSSRALTRVEKAFETYAPDITLPIIQVVGRLDQLKVQVASLPNYGVMQYVLRSTLRPHTRDWIDLWRRARVVWSYLDLQKLCYEDGIVPDFNFYHAPLGCESAAFFPIANSDKHFRVLTTGRSWLTESVRECVLAATSLGAQAVHIGTSAQRGNLTIVNGIDDTNLNFLYNQSSYVSGLRRIEGFELPAVEALFTGTCPILFDQSHYRKWYGDLACFIPEGGRTEVEASLTALFSKEPPSVNIELARARFNWPTLLQGFKDRL